MTEKIEQFDTWFSEAKPGDEYTYFTGNLSHAAGLIDGYPLRQLRKHIMDKCCKWDLNPLPKKQTDNKIIFKSSIRLVQKSHPKYWDKKQKDILNGADYIAVKL
jgi:hypothetical protein